MRRNFDPEKRPKPRRGAEPEDSPAEPSSRPQQPAAGAGLPRFMRQHTGPEGARVRAKHTVSQAGDPDEQHADLAAERVMRAESPGGAGESAERVQRKERGSGGSNAAAARPSQGMGGGQPLDAAARAFFEPRFGEDFGHVRLHTGPEAAESARAMHARAYSVGDDIVFGEGEYSSESTEGQRLLAHELAHTLQPASPEGRVRRYDPPPTEEVGLQTAEESGRDEGPMTHYLAGQSHRMVAADRELSEAHPGTPEEREALEETLMRAVRLNAIGLMASHRASIEAARDRLEGRERYRLEGDPPPQTTGGVLADMRDAAQLVSNLQAIEERLQGYKSELHLAETRALLQRGDINDTLELLYENGNEFMDEELFARLRENWKLAEKRDTYWLFAYGAAGAMQRMREEQIAGTRLAISEVYTQFPLFAELDPSEVASGSLSSDEALLEASREAYRKVLEKVDIAIVNVATDDTHPFDMPRAVEVTRAGKPPEVQQALDEAVERREQNRFWLNLGFTAAEVLLCFIPVVGPALAVGLGAAALGLTVEEMLDRVTLAEASTDPYDSPVGVHEPSAFEWAMAAVGGILMAFGGAGIAREAMPSFRAFRALGRLAPELSAGSRMRLARMAVRQPELLVGPRTSAGLAAELSAAGVEVSTAEVQALRALSFKQAGLPLGRTSGQNIESFLDDIWDNRQEIMEHARRQNMVKRSRRQRTADQDPAFPVLKRYGEAERPNPLSMEKDEYFARAERLGEGRPPGSVSDLQSPETPYDTFHRFMRPKFKQASIKERIFLHVNADQAPEVMEYVVRRIVDDHSLPGVQMAKMSGAGLVGHRVESIVIYLDDAAASETVLARLRYYEQANPGRFRPGSPPMTEEMTTGVSVGQQPSGWASGFSFGQVRSGAIYKALEDVVSKGGTREEFVARVREMLRTYEINPDAPHLNLPSASDTVSKGP